MSLVIVYTFGGLGNQMFQYAAGRALALRRDAKLVLNLSNFRKGGKRQYALNHFRIKALIPRLPLSLEEAYCEPHFHFDKTMQALQPPVYLVGLWQSEKYFLDCAALIREEFTPRARPDIYNGAIAIRIRCTNSVSLHVRRGDYVSNPVANDFHGVCSKDYYQRAVDYIASRVERPHFFVFSDDPDWPRRNLHFRFPTTFVDKTAATTDFRDIQLMSLCRHHIIANSTFSWWGAWLNPARNKIVVAPSHWFNNARGFDARDIIPDSWVRL